MITYEPLKVTRCHLHQLTTVLLLILAAKQAKTPPEKQTATSNFTHPLYDYAHLWHELPPPPIPPTAAASDGGERCHISGDKTQLRNTAPHRALYIYIMTITADKRRVAQTDAGTAPHGGCSGTYLALAQTNMPYIQDTVYFSRVVSTGRVKPLGSGRVR